MMIRALLLEWLYDNCEEDTHNTVSVLIPNK